MLTESVVLLAGITVAVTTVALLAGKSRTPPLTMANTEMTAAGVERKLSKGLTASAPASARFVALTSVPDLDRLLERSAAGPVWIFQHDPFCPISRAAWKEVSRFGGEVALVDVASCHDVTRAIEARTGVRHESPQVLFIARSQAVWTASHSAITAAAMAQAADRSSPR